MSDRVFQRALEIFRERGGARARYIDTGTGQVCVLGAVALACGVTEEQLHEVDTTGVHPDGSKFPNDQNLELARLATELFPGRYNAWEVNDELGRDAAEQLLEKAAVREAEVEGL